VPTTASDSDEARVPRPLQAAACTCRIAFAPRAGHKVLTVQGAMPRDADFKQTLCADIDGFSVHAAVRCGADDRQALEQLCRDITRPALPNERVQTNAAGQGCRVKPVSVGVRTLISSANDRLKEPQWRRDKAGSAANRGVPATLVVGFSCRVEQAQLPWVQRAF
jgi:Putative transposase